MTMRTSEMNKHQSFEENLLEIIDKWKKTGRMFDKGLCNCERRV
jgi:hypothetical protein